VQVFVSVRAGAIRLSVGIYVTAAMVEHFCALMDAFFRADYATATFLHQPKL
jgi:hypothetical protein